MANRNSGGDGPQPEVMPSERGEIKKKRRTSNTTGSSVLSLGSGEEKSVFMAAAPPAPVSRRTRLASIAAKKNTLLSNKNPMNKVTIGSQRR
jgi:hypothetical protein